MNVSKYNKLPHYIKEKLKVANIYYDAKYCEYEKTKNNLVLYLYDDSFIQAVSIHSIKKIFSTARLLSEPFSLSDNQYNQNDLQAFLNSVLITLRKKIKVDWLESTLAGSVFQSYPEESKRIRWGNYIIDLSGKSIEEVFAGFDSKHRNMVRRGERANITIKFGGKELLNDYLLLDKETWSRSNVTADNSYSYQQCLDALGENAILGIAYKDGVPQCGLLGFYNQAMFYYMYGASANRPEPGSTHYLQFQTIKLMVEKGVQAYNFVGCRINVDKDSKYEHIQHFKRGFGGKLVECYMFKSVLNKSKYKLFRLLYSLKGRKLVNDAIDDEIHKWIDIN